MSSRVLSTLPSNNVFVRVSSSFTPYKPTKQTENEKKPSVFTNFQSKFKDRLFNSDRKTGFLNGPSTAPLSFSYPNKKGRLEFDPKYSFEDIKDELIPYLKTNTKASQIFNFLTIFF